MYSNRVPLGAKPVPLSLPLLECRRFAALLLWASLPALLGFALYSLGLV